MIPKIIHLCWFSFSIPPKKLRRCIRSWRKFMPEYRIMWWTRRRALSSGIPFVKEAIEQKKWAFAADAIRLYAVYKYGGLYLDSDILLHKSLDELLTHKNVFFSETYPDRVEYESLHAELTKEEKWGQEIQAACFAAQKGSKVIAAILSLYQNSHFVRQDGTLSMSTVAPQVFAWALEQFGYVYKDDEQVLDDDTAVYPSSLVLSNPRFSSGNKYATHLCAQSWKEAPQDR